RAWATTRTERTRSTGMAALRCIIWPRVISMPGKYKGRARGPQGSGGVALLYAGRGRRCRLRRAAPEGLETLAGGLEVGASARRQAQDLAVEGRGLGALALELAQEAQAQEPAQAQRVRRGPGGPQTLISGGRGRLLAEALAAAAQGVEGLQ